MPRGAHRPGLDLSAALLDHPARNLIHHLFEEKAQVAATPIIGWRDVAHPIGVGRKLVALLESDPLMIVGIVDRDGMPGVFAHDGEARHIGRPVAQINHVRERHRANGDIYVIVHVLRHIEEPFIDAEKDLRLLRVADDVLRKGDPALFVLGKSAAENRAHLRRQPAPLDQHLDARGDDVMLDSDAVGALLVIEQVIAEIVEHFGSPLWKLSLAPSSLFVVSRAIHP